MFLEVSVQILCSKRKTNQKLKPDFEDVSHCGSLKFLNKQQFPFFSSISNKDTCLLQFNTPHPISSSKKKSKIFFQ